MSTPKKETPEPEHKKAAPKKVVKKKVTKPVSISHTLAPVTVVTTTEEYKAPNIQDLHAEFGVKDIPHQVEEEVKQSATGVWGKAKEWWSKWKIAVIIVVILIIAWVVSGWIINNQRNKSVKETQQTEQRIEDGKAGLARSEQNLQDLQHRRVDSNYRAALQSIFEQLKTASDQYEAYHAQMIERNELYKTKNDELQKRIANASDDSLLRIGRELSK